MVEAEELGARNDQFTRVVDETLTAVSRYALRRAANSADAEDAVAETYAVAWRRRDQLPTGPEALPWLYGVARNVLANQHRSQRRWGRLHLKVAGQPQQHAPDADGIVERQPVLDALGKLPPDDAELLRLLTWEQLRQSEAAQVLGISENAVALRASRARKRLAEILDDRSSNVVDMKDRTTERRSDEV